MELMAKPQPLHLVTAERHHQRATLAKIDVVAGLRLQRGAKLRPLLLAFKRERQEVMATRLVLGRGCEHAGSGKTCTGASGGALEHCDRQAAQRQAPGN